MRAGLTVPDGTDGVRLRYADPAEALDACEAVYARLVPGRPGMLARLPGWERLGLLDPESTRGGASPLQCVVAERDGATVGYARFRVKPSWGPGGPEGEVALSALEALDPAAGAALWRFLFDLDLTSSLRVRGRPVDDSWQYLVKDIRRCRPALRDALYVRPVEVGAALAARTYRTPVDVVLEVEDAFCPWNAGHWRLSGDARGRPANPPATRPTSLCRPGNWAPPTWAERASPHWRRPAGYANCAPARWPRRRRRSPTTRHRGCRTASDRRRTAGRSLRSGPLAGRAPEEVAGGERGRVDVGAADVAGAVRPAVDVDLAAVVVDAGRAAHGLGVCSGRTVSMRLARTPSRIRTTRSSQTASHSARVRSCLEAR